MQSNAAHPPSLMRETLRMAWPAVLESFFVALASMIDTLMVSSLGSTAVAAVGLTVQPKFLGFALFMATNVAVSALVARRRGQRDRHHCFSHSIGSFFFDFTNLNGQNRFCK